MQIIAGSIDLNKIDKTRIKEHANGALYYDINIIVNDEPDKFGQHASIAQGQTKEEREAKVPRVYLGNGKIVFSK
jgi:hypothetical protein